jgi:hypothetical protein
MSRRKKAPKVTGPDETFRSGGGLVGRAKHRQAFGKGNRNPRVNKEIAKELNAEHDEQQARRERRKGPMFPSVADLMKDQEK